MRKTITLAGWLTLAATALATEPVKTPKPSNEPLPVILEMLRIKDPVTGEIRKPTATELYLLMPENPLSRKSDDLVEKTHKTGGGTLVLNDRFQSAIMARIGPDGKVETACVKSDRQARAFLAKPLKKEKNDAQ